MGKERRTYPNYNFVYAQAVAKAAPEERHKFLIEMNKRVDLGIHYLSQRIEKHLNSPNWEQTWATMRWLAYAYQVPYLQTNALIPFCCYQDGRSLVEFYFNLKFRCSYHYDSVVS